MLRALLDAAITVTEVNLGTAVVFVWAERIRPSLPGQRHLRSGLWLDLAYTYLGGLVGLLISLAGLGRAVAAGGAWGRVQGVTRDLPLLAQVVLAIVLGDFTGYWKHRILHTRLLWPFHAVHHSSEDVDWLSNERLHPVEMVLMSTFFTAPLLLLGFPVAAIVWAGQIRRIHSVYEHANLDFRYGRAHYVLVSPTFHRWHHSTDPAWVDMNFANIFSFFDWMFGTFKLPEGPPPAGTFGVPGFPSDLGRQLAYPVRDAAFALRPAASPIPAVPSAPERARPSEDVRGAEAQDHDGAPDARGDVVEHDAVAPR